MDFNWINLAVGNQFPEKPAPDTCFEWMEHVVATDRVRIHIWYNPDAATFCASQDLLDDSSVNRLFQIIESSQPDSILDERQDGHWIYLLPSEGPWLCFNSKFYEELKIAFPGAAPMIGSNDWGRFVCFRSDTCMGALMEYAIS